MADERNVLLEYAVLFGLMLLTAGAAYVWVVRGARERQKAEGSESALRSPSSGTDAG
jgi:hypothetical protein